MNLTTSQLKKLVVEKVDIVDILYKNNPDGHYHPGQTCFCPFHDNDNTPAASIYDNEGITSLYCFSERKLYTSADAIEILLNKNVYEVAKRLWDRMSDAEKQVWLSENSDESLEEAFSLPSNKDKPVSIEIKKAENDFKNRKITIKELLESIISNS